MKRYYFENKVKKVLILLLIPMTIIIQIFIIKLLPAKYFYDSRDILAIVNNPQLENVFDESYVFVAKVFKKINIFNFSSFSQWAYLISSIVISISVIKLYKYKKISVTQMIFIYLTIIIQNIYVYRISKDIIQAIFFTTIDMLILNTKLKQRNKVIGIVIVLIVEAIIFRYYYYLTAILFLFVYWIITNSKKTNPAKILIIFLTFLCIGLYVMKFVSITSYYELIYVRERMNMYREDSPDAVTQINNIIKNDGNPITYIINYIINLFRLMFPFELVFRGEKYVFFIVYQLYITWILIRRIVYLKENREDKIMKLLISIMVAYALVATMHEPDFGSFVRHESTLCFIMLDMMLIEKDGKIKTEFNGLEAMQSEQ